MEVRHENRSAVLYARFSPRRVRDEDHIHTIQMQLNECRKYCAYHNMPIAGEWYDEHASGRNSNRPGFKNAMNQVGLIKGALVVYKLSRFGRSTNDVLSNVAHLEKVGAELVLVSEKLDTQTPMGRCMFTIFAAFAQMERETISEATRDSVLYRLTHGITTFVSRKGSPPYGYKPDHSSPWRRTKKRNVKYRSRFLPDEEQQAVIRMIRLNMEGLSLNEVARRLNKMGIPFRDGARWTHDAVRAIRRRNWEYAPVPKTVRSALLKPDGVNGTKSAGATSASG